MSENTTSVDSKGVGTSVMKGKDVGLKRVNLSRNRKLMGHGCVPDLFTFWWLERSPHQPNKTSESNNQKSVSPRKTTIPKTKDYNDDLS